MAGSRRMSEVPAIVLAGGLATRMGGGDKCLLPLGQSRIIDHVLGRLSGPVALNANGDPGRFAGLGLPVLPDSLPGHLGPLAGLLAGMDWAAAQGATQVLSVAGDTPFFPPDLAARLAGPADAIAIATSSEADGRSLRQPTFGLWPCALAADLRAALLAGTRKIILWAETHPLRLVDCGSSSLFFNINTNDDLARAEAALKVAR